MFVLNHKRTLIRLFLAEMSIVVPSDELLSSWGLLCGDVIHDAQVMSCSVGEHGEMRGTFAEMSNMTPGVMRCLAWGRGVEVGRRGAFAQLGCV